MAGVIARIGRLKVGSRRLPPYQSLIRAIIHQQLSGKAAATILGRFENIGKGGRFPRPEEIVATSSESLRAAGLSGAKTSYVRDVAQKTMDGFVPSLEECDAMDDEELIDRLTAIKGVGRWTAEMLLIFNLGRPDVLPVGDLGVRRGYQMAYKKRELPDGAELERQGQVWAPFRTTAALYLWRAVDFLKGEAW